MLSDLEIIFTSAARVEVLRLFLLNADRQFYQREIERETGQPIRAVQREVKRLGEVELLTRSEEGNRVFYRVNPVFPLLPELTALFEKASGRKVGITAAQSRASRPVEAGAGDEPFSWLEPVSAGPLPAALREIQMDGEWDRAY
jgi:DNA-binding transcriptional ArsR family regulator